MASAHTSITVAQTAITLRTGEPSKRFNTGPGGKRNLLLTNTGANPVFIGKSGVTSSAYGFSLAAGGVSPILEVSSNDELFAISTTGSNVVKAFWFGA